MIAAIICMVDSIEDEDEQEAVRDEVRSTIKEMDGRRRYPLSHMRVYTTPAALPHEMFTFAYGHDGDKPLDLEVPELGGIMKVPCRGGGGSRDAKANLKKQINDVQKNNRQTGHP